MQKKYGWMPDLADNRDEFYSPPKMASLPDKFDLSGQMPEIYNQKKLGSCVAQSLSALLQQEELKLYGKVITIPSRLFIYYNQRSILDTVESDSGATIRSGMKALENFGYPNEEFWPYEPSQFKVKPPRIAYRYGALNKITKYQRIKNNLNVLKSTIVAGKAFVFGFVVYPNFENLVGNILEVPNSNESSMGGHCVVAIGYDDSDETFLVRNSYGKNWKLNGHFKMKYEYITKPELTADFWTLDINKRNIEN